MSASVDPTRDLFRLWGEIKDLDAARELLDWDQETQMPPQGQDGRGKLLSTLAGLRHERLTSSALADALDAADEHVASGVLDDEEAAELAAHVCEARRIVDRTVRLPAALARAKAEAVSAGHVAWKRARAEADFALFRDPLEQLIRIAREEAYALAGDGMTPYDALLDEFEPGARESDLVPLFAQVREALAPLVRAVAESGRRVDPAPAKGDYPVAAQRELGLHVARAMGFDFDAGRLDPAVHPFCTSFNPRDTRLTWRWKEDDFRPALFGIMHEAGHGLYEQGLPVRWYRTPLGGAVSLGVHESQSRLWENLVGRSRDFWEWLLPTFHRLFPAKRDVGVDELWPTLRTVEPSLIRVEADEGTYDLHIVVRFELERRLIRGELEVDDLPAAWDDAYEDALGIRPANAAEGVLQDLHWSSCSFGYFPTYTLGNLMMAQLFATAREALPDLSGQIARGELAPLRDWLRESVHRHGARYPAAELIERATGRPLDPEDYLRMRRAAVEAVYPGAI